MIPKDYSLSSALFPVDTRPAFCYTLVGKNITLPPTRGERFYSVLYDSGGFKP
jgi:hypothetical protein